MKLSFPLTVPAESPVGTTAYIGVGPGSQEGLNTRSDDGDHGSGSL